MRADRRIGGLALSPDGSTSTVSGKTKGTSSSSPAAGAVVSVPLPVGLVVSVVDTRART